MKVSDFNINEVLSMIWMFFLWENEERGEGVIMWNKNRQEGFRNMKDFLIEVVVFEDGGEGYDLSSVGRFWKLKFSVGCYFLRRQRRQVFSGKFFIRLVIQIILEIDSFFRIQKESVLIG